MSGIKLAATSVVELHDLHFGADGDGGFEVGRPATGVFIALGTEGAAVLRWLATGMPLASVAEQFHHQFHGDVDIEDFVREISGCGFVKSVDGHPLLDETQAAEGNRGWRLLGSLAPSRVSWLLSRPARALFVMVWLTLPVLLVMRPALFPTAEDAIIGPGILTNLVVLTLLGWLLAFLHELAHLVAVRARGSEATLDISHRLHILVAQTDMTAVRALPRNQRYAPYLAGMTWDAAVLLTISLLAAAGRTAPLTQAAAYLLMMSLLFEFALFLRTDLYYVLTNALRLGNLAGDSRRWLLNLLSRILRRDIHHDLSGVPARELRWVRWYAVLAAAGVGVTLAQFVFLGLPLLAVFVAQASAGLAEGVGALDFWSSVATLAVVAAQFGLLGLGMIREHRRRRSRTELMDAGRAAISEA